MIETKGAEARREEHGFPDTRPGEHALAGRAWQRPMDEQHLLERSDPCPITEGKGGKRRITRSTLFRESLSTGRTGPVQAMDVFRRQVIVE
jgi:hypothetical protein